jgi:hypothetical protein
MDVYLGDIMQDPLHGGKPMEEDDWIVIGGQSPRACGLLHPMFTVIQPVLIEDHESGPRWDRSGEPVGVKDLKRGDRVKQKWSSGKHSNDVLVIILVQPSYAVGVYVRNSNLVLSKKIKP